MLKNGFKLATLILIIFFFFILNGCNTMNDSVIATSSHQVPRIYRLMSNYEKIKAIRWPTIHQKGSLMVGSHSSNIPLIRQRLIALGDLSNKYASRSEVYDGILMNAVKNFQWRHGLDPDGEIGPATIAALNVSPKKRLAQLKKNLQRWQNFSPSVGSRYIQINIPSYQLDLIEKGKKVLNMRVVVGKPKRPTPTLYSKVETIVFNPKWNVPDLIANKDIIPKIIENPDFLTEQNISVYSSFKRDAYKIDPKDIDWKKVQEEGFPYKFSQSPGFENALGKVKFIFLNNHDVYMHDTPQKGLFGKIYRAYSSGCIRLEKPFQLVEYFIQNQDTLNTEEVVNYLADDNVKYVKIKNPIPLYITYITAWVDHHGIPHFREDIYEKDS